MNFHAVVAHTVHFTYRMFDSARLGFWIPLNILFWTLTS